MTPQTDSPILVTGGSGFVGSHLIEVLQAHGFQNIHATTASARPSYVQHLLAADHIHQVDLTDQTSTATLIKHLQPTHIYHLAAFATVGTSFDQAFAVLENNLKLQLSLLDVIKQHAPSARLLAVGSGMEYDLITPSENQHQPITERHALGPVSPYAVSKVFQDLLSLSYSYAYKLDIVRARPFNHIGERQTADFAIPSFAQQIVAIERGQQTDINVGNLDAVRDFTDVKDVCEAYVLLMAHGQANEVYNIGSGQGYQMQHMLDWLCELSSVEVKITTDPTKIRPLDVPSMVADISKISSLGWQPHIPIKQTLHRVLEYWRTQS